MVFFARLETTFALWSLELQVCSAVTFYCDFDVNIVAWCNRSTSVVGFICCRKVFPTRCMNPFLQQFVVYLSALNTALAPSF